MRRVGGVLGLAIILLAGCATPVRAQVPANNRGLWTCSLDSVAASLTECLPIAGQPPGTRAWVTNIVAQSTTATGGLFLLRYGTGTNCGTGTTSLFPAASTVVRLIATANTTPPTVIELLAGVAPPVGNAICVLGVVTNTTNITITGYYNP